MGIRGRKKIELIEGRPITDHPKVQARFLDVPIKIERRGEWECWIWQGDIHYKGYGDFSAACHHYKAHRVSYEFFVEVIPPSLVIDHLCRTRNCINPDHLEPCTDLENKRRGLMSGRQRPTYCIRGHLLDEANTIIRRTGWRNCKRCKQLWRPNRNKQQGNKNTVT